MTRDEFLEESKKQLTAFREEMKDLQEKAVHASDEAKVEFETRYAEVEALYQDAAKKFEEVRSQTEEQWVEVRDFAILTTKALRHSFNYFMSHYRKKED